MNVVRTTDKGIVLLLSSTERAILVRALAKYPLLSHTHHRSFKDDGDERAEESQELLEQALKEQKAEVKAQLKAWLNDGSRWIEVEGGFELKVSYEHREWLLQVFNDLRVGSWVALGEPEELQPGLDILLNTAKRKAYWLMEAAGFFQSILLFDEDY